MGVFETDAPLVKRRVFVRVERADNAMERHAAGISCWGGAVLAGCRHVHGYKGDSCKQ